MNQKLRKSLQVVSVLHGTDAIKYALHAKKPVLRHVGKEVEETLPTAADRMYWLQDEPHDAFWIPVEGETLFHYCLADYGFPPFPEGLDILDYTEVVWQGHVDKLRERLNSGKIVTDDIDIICNLIAEHWVGFVRHVRMGEAHEALVILGCIEELMRGFNPEDSQGDFHSLRDGF